MAEGSLEECRYFLILTKGLGYGDTQALSAALEEVSKLLWAYTAAILTPDFHIPQGYQGEALTSRGIRRSWDRVVKKVSQVLRHRSSLPFQTLPDPDI
jgi:hypothetical protein